jgi:hypothetical protein
MNASSAVQKIEPQHIAHAMTPMEMLAQAIDRSMPIETVDKLLVLAERWDKTQARKAFDAAVAAARLEIPVIIKIATGHNNKKYADFATIARTIDPILGKHGLGYRFRTIQDEKAIRTACILFHKDGHSEENTLSGPADASGSKNAIQAIGSTLTYLQRYSLIQALGLAASEDDDGRGAGIGEKITDDQAATLREMIESFGADERRFCTYLKVAALSDLPASRLSEATDALKAKRK